MGAPRGRDRASAAARCRSPPGWAAGSAATSLFRAAQPGVGFEDGEFFRAMLPALPAYILLAAAIPLLVPTLAVRLGPLAQRCLDPVGRLARRPDPLLEQRQRCARITFWSASFEITVE